MAHYDKSHGFSLVELSIVLVILGLLVGGILAGQSLIRAAELRSVSTEYQRYITASYAFRDKYFALPGDFRDATRFWLRENTTNCITNSSATTNTAGGCDGDGNGSISSSGPVSGASEQFQFWQHLALAGLIEGTYSGRNSPTLVGEGVVGTNRPRARFSTETGWNALVQSTVGANHALWSNNNYGNSLWLAGDYTGLSTPYRNVMKPEDAWNIDTKLDDGLPQQGKIWAVHWDTCTNAASAAAINGTYDLQVTTNACALIFPNAF